MTKNELMFSLLFVAVFIGPILFYVIGRLIWIFVQAFTGRHTDPAWDKGEL